MPAQTGKHFRNRKPLLLNFITFTGIQSSMCTVRTGIDMYMHLESPVYTIKALCVFKLYVLKKYRTGIYSRTRTDVTPYLSLF